MCWNWLNSIVWNVLCVSFRSICAVVFFKSALSLPVLCLDDLSIVGSGVLKSSAIIALLSISPFYSVNNCFASLDTLTRYSFIEICISFYHVPDIILASWDALKNKTEKYKSILKWSLYSSGKWVWQGIGERERQ